MKLKKWIALALGAAVIATGIPAGTVAQVQGAESEAWERTELNFNTGLAVQPCGLCQRRGSEFG